MPNRKCCFGGLNKRVVRIECYIYWTGSCSTYASEMIPVTKEPAVKPAINNIIANVVSPFLSQTKLCCHRKNFIINSLYIENITRDTLRVDYLVAKKGVRDYNKQSWSRIWDETIPFEGSYFQVRIVACQFPMTENVYLSL